MTAKGLTRVEPTANPDVLVTYHANFGDHRTGQCERGGHEGRRTARLLSSLRPAAPILAVTPGPAAAGRLAVCWGVTPLVSEERDVARLRAELLRRRLVTPGSVVVFINVSHDLDRTDTNFLNLQQFT